MSDVSDDLVQRVARAILESDATCNYDKCKDRVEKDVARGSNLELGWWEHLHDQARAAIAVVRAQAWQLIETAPKDGTVILIADSRAVYAAFWNGKHEPNFPWRFVDPSEDDGFNGWMGDKFGPTHWMPLPSPPEADT